MPHMSTVTVNGIPQAYDEAGEGRALLLLHAGIADRRMWDDAWPMLTARHRVIRPDLRGYGETSLPDGTFSWTADAAALLGELAVERAHVVGVSMGAGVALDLALGRPELVDRLVLVAPGLSGWQYAEAMDQFDADESAALERGDRDAASWLNVRFWVDGPHRSPEEVDAALRQRVYEMQKLAFDVDNPTAELEWLVPDRAARLEEVRAPTLVVAGELDQPDFVAIGRHIADRVPGARYELMPGVAHLPPMEAPEAFSRLVLGFLAE
jgi:pimeloyl-ACP methyl ester carboxylesterase